MPSFIIPARSGVHRQACLSLYRALLSTTVRLPTSDSKFGGLRKVIRTQFRQKKGLQSPSQISKSLKAGYEALDLLDSCSHGNPESIDKLGTLRQEALALRGKIRSERKALGTLNPPEDKTTRRAKRRAQAQELSKSIVRHPDAEPIVSRPRPEVSGRRRVPVLVNARGVPFLRIKKPQPASLSRVIDSKLRKRWRRILLRERLEEEERMARLEDKWDERVGEVVTESWTVPILESLKEVRDRIKNGDKENKRIAEEMWQVVLRERELAEKEKEERIALRRQRRLEAKKASAIDDDGQQTGGNESHKGSGHTTRASNNPTDARVS